MIRVGRYDAFDKWEIVCRHWAEPGAIGDIGTDKFKRPRLPRWHVIAAAAGQLACADYIRGKLEAISAGSSAAAVDEPQINREVAALLERMAGWEVQALVGDIAERIIAGGIEAPLGDGLPSEFVSRVKKVFANGALQALRWTEDPGEVPTIDILRAQATGDFPHAAVRGCRNVLCLFAAWFYGRSDVIHVHDARPAQVTLVDLHQPSLDDMKLIYPAHWRYACADFRDFLESAEPTPTYDLIVSDPFRGFETAVAWELLPKIMELCSDTFITNYFVEMFEELGVARDDREGLARAIAKRTGVDLAVAEILPRNSDVSWVVMRKR